MSINKEYNCSEFKKLLRENNKLSLILLDIDNFSNINDSYGIEYGDIVFVKIIQMLHDLRIKNSEIYKLESDEFAIVSRETFDVVKLREIAELIISFFNEVEIEIEEDINVKVSFSIGIAKGSGITTLNQARLAIKELRVYDRGSYLVYDMKSQFIRNIQDNVYWVNKIQQSAVEGNIVVFYQPIVDNKTNRVDKYECLARIYDDGDYVSPYSFMDAAKETKLLPTITRSVIKQACKMFSKNNYEFSINITNDDLQLNYLEDYLIRNAKLHDISLDRIVLELLEDIPSLDKEIVINQLKSLQAKGFKLSIDDFGSESSNFSRLLEFDADYLKIDGAFIKNILMDNKSQIITQGIVKIAHGMNMKVIAEYIHNEDIQEEVAFLGVDYSQGYFHGEPLQILVEED